MHYPWTAFSKNGKKTLEPIRPLNGKTPYIGLSDDDALQARRMYKCPSKFTIADMMLYVLLLPSLHTYRFSLGARKSEKV